MADGDPFIDRFLRPPQGEDPYIKALFGQHARKVAFNYVVQDPTNAENKAGLVGTTSFAKEMGFEAKGTHVLVLCDAIIRPHFVIESQHLEGEGLTHMLTDGMADIDAWLRHGRVILNAGNRKEAEFSLSRHGRR